MRIAIIVNPVSGRKGRYRATGELRVAHAHRLIEPLGVEADVVATSAAGHGAELSRGFAARGYDVVMAWGGDGTVNEVAGPLIGTRTALGIIPSGSGDGLAGSLGLSRDPAAAFTAAVTGESIAIDVGYLGDRHFVNAAGVGFDAAIAADFARSRARGIAGYMTRIMTMIWGYQQQDYEVGLDGARRAGRYLMVAFANGKEYGNHLVLAPEASAHDGWLDAVIVDGGPAWRQLLRARRLLFAPAAETQGISRVRVQSASVRGRRLQCHVDGEPFEATGPLSVRILPGALRVCGLARE